MITTENIFNIKFIIDKYKEQDSNTDVELLAIKLEEFKKLFQLNRNKILKYCLENAPDWNVFRLVGVEQYEVSFHSIFLKELLSPSGTHGQGRLFLNSFIRMIGDFSEYEITHENWNVLREINNIDLLIANDVLQKSILIENKVYSKAHSGQLSSYFEFWRKKYPNGGCFSYLTITGDKPKDDGYNHLSEISSRSEIESIIRLLSYKKCIKNWLEETIDGIKSERVKQSVIQYIETINNL